VKDEDMIAECMELVGEGLFTSWEEEFLWDIIAEKDDGLENCTDKQREKLEEIHEKRCRDRETEEIR